MRIMKIIPQNVHNNMFNLLYKEDNSEIPALSKSYHGERQYFNFPKTNCTICGFCTLQCSVLQYQHILSKIIFTKNVFMGMLILNNFPLKYCQHTS